jgi:DNA-binding transcriptional LysR family regulator
MLPAMARTAKLDPELVLAFVLIAEERSFTRAAERLGRPQSVVTTQVQRLEARLGQKVLLREQGGTVRLTPHGQYLLQRSRTLLALNDEIWTTFHAPPVHGSVRLGTPDDYALHYLPLVLRRFADQYPAIEVQVQCAPSFDLVQRLKAGELDLTLCMVGHEPRRWSSVELWRGPLMWITSERHLAHRLDPLPLALAGEDCAWRRAATRALERAGQRYRIAYRSTTQACTHAPVLAGLAITVASVAWVPEGLRTLRPDEGLPALPETGLLLLRARASRQPVAGLLAAHIAQTFHQEMRRMDRG